MLCKIQSLLFKNSYARSVSLLTLSQLSSKIFRFLATIFIARLLIPEDYGLIAITWSINEIFLATVRRCTQTRIINCPDDELNLNINAARFLNLRIVLVTAILQIFVAAVTYCWYRDITLFYTIGFLGLSHLLLPLAMIHSAIHLRLGKMERVALSEFSQSFFENSLTIGLLLSGFGVWSIVLPKALAIPVWVVIHRYRFSYVIVLTNCDSMLEQLKKHSQKIIISDLVTVLRANIDYLIIGTIMTVDALGIYFFSFNAGLGIANSIILVCSSALLPHLCSANGDLHLLRIKLISALKTFFTLLILIITLQISLANWYVPLVFGSDWIERGALPILVLLCLSAIPRSILEICSQLLRSQNRITLDLIGNSIVTIGLAVVITVSAEFGLVAIAATITVYLSVASFIYFLLTFSLIFQYANKEKIQKNNFLKSQLKAQQVKI